MKKRTYVEVESPDQMRVERPFPGMRMTGTMLARPLQPRKLPLPPGRQYIAHDKPGGRAAQRRLRQQQQITEKKYHG